MNWMIETEGLTKVYKNHNHGTALQNLDLKVREGQLYGLLGSDGAGKTTTLRILSTVLDSSGGTARISGYDLRTEPEKARQFIGYMPQNFSLYPDLSVIENLLFFARIQQVTQERISQRIKELLAFTRLDGFQERRAGKLSGGMKKKLALACALIHEPKVLLLDEPSTGVDPVSRRELWKILAEVVEGGVTVLVSTPYMDEAERCHEVGVLYQGKLITAGTPDQLEAELPFNILEVKVKPRKAMRRIVGETENILDWRPVGDILRLAIPNHNTSAIPRMMRSLNTRFKREGLDIEVLRPAKRTMEDVFVYLVGLKRSEA